MRYPAFPVRRSLAAGALVFALSGCGSGATGPAVSSATTSDALQAMETGLQDEYRAAEVYEAVLASFGNVLPFSNIVRAERQHAASIEALFTARGLPIPTREVMTSLPTFASVVDACALGVTAEIDNVALYDRLLGLSLPADVRRVFEANRRASIEKHLPAFTRCGPMIIGAR